MDLLSFLVFLQGGGGWYTFLSQSLVAGLILDYLQVKCYPLLFEGKIQPRCMGAHLCTGIKLGSKPSSVFSSRQIYSPDIIAHATFSTRDIEPLKMGEMLYFWQLLPSTDWNNKNNHEAVGIASAYNVICLWFSLLL